MNKISNYYDIKIQNKWYNYLNYLIDKYSQENTLIKNYIDFNSILKTKLLSNSFFSIDFLAIKYKHLSDEDFWYNVSYNKNLYNNYILQQFYQNNTVNYYNQLFNWDEISKSNNINDELLTKINFVCPYIKWNYENLSVNNNISYQYVKNNKIQDWNWEKVSATKNIDIEDFKEWRFGVDCYLSLTDYLKYQPISINKFTELIKIIGNEYIYLISIISANKNVDLDFYLHFKDLNWDYYYLSESNHIEEIINYLENSTNQYLWNWGSSVGLMYETMYGISDNKKLSLEFIEKHIDKLNFDYLSNNNNLNDNFIKKYKDRDWNIDKLIKNKNLSIDIINILDNPKYIWTENRIDLGFQYLKFDFNDIFINKYPNYKNKKTIFSNSNSINKENLKLIINNIKSDDLIDVEYFLNLALNKNIDIRLFLKESNETNIINFDLLDSNHSISSICNNLVNIDVNKSKKQIITNVIEKQILNIFRNLLPTEIIDLICEYLY